MKKLTFCLSAIVFFSVTRFCLSQESPKGTTERTRAAEVVEQMRGFSMQMQAGARSDGTVDAKEQRRQRIIKDLRELGEEAIPVLAGALDDTDVQMRRNSELAMIDLAGGYSSGGRRKVDISAAVPALIKATEDQDPEVRAWAAHALAEVGPKAKEAVPALIRLLEDSQEGPRNTSCMALGAIGPLAKQALPALQKAENDPSKDVRQFARQAIKNIQK